MAQGLDLGPLAPLIGEWKTVKDGIDVAAGRTDSAVGEGGPAVESFYEIRTFEVAGDAVNASDQHLTAVYYKAKVFRKRDDAKFHDQRGYLLYDKKIIGYTTLSVYLVESVLSRKAKPAVK